jgi:hypothetical protein
MRCGVRIARTRIHLGHGVTVRELSDSTFYNYKNVIQYDQLPYKISITGVSTVSKVKKKNENMIFIISRDSDTLMHIKNLKLHEFLNRARRVIQ